MINNNPSQHIFSKRNQIIIARFQDGFTPFIERPSDEYDIVGVDKGKRINAFDLFSIFTADIIREEIVFTR